MKQRLNIYTPLVLLMIITLVAPLTIASIDTGVDFSYSFENFPDNIAVDDSGNGFNADLSDVFNMISSNAKIGDWAVSMSETTHFINSSGLSNSNPRSYSFWLYPTSTYTTTSYKIFSDAFSYNSNHEGWHFWLGVDNNAGTSSVVQTDMQQFTLITGQGGGGATPHIRWENTTIVYDEWNHITLLMNNDRPSGATLYINNEEMNSSGGSDTDGSFTGENIIIGGIHSGSSSGGVNTNSPKNIDQFIRYNRILSEQEISALYNNGIGADPFDSSSPTQIASIAPVNLAFNGFLQYDLNDFFTGATSYDITFNYSLASYNVSSGDSVNTGDFAIQLENNLVNFFGLNNEVQPVTLNINAHNTGGTTTTTTTLRVGFGASNIPFQIASVAPITLTPTTSTTRRFSDFFMDYTNTYIEYVDPDTQQTVTVSAGFPNSNSCISTNINGDILTVTAKNITCSINARLVVDDGITGVYSNEFRISVTQSGTETGSEYLNTIFNLLPPADTIGFAARMLYVAIVMIFTAMAGAFIIFSTPNINGTLISAGIGVLLLSEFLFFTAIGYIPIWIVITLGSLAAVIGISIFRTNTMGH